MLEGVDMSTYIDGFEIIHDLIKKRWIPEILSLLAHKSVRYSDISEEIDYISHTELNRKLKLLLSHRCIEKVEYENQVNYKITKFGYEIDHIFNHLKKISDSYNKASS